MTSAEKGPWVVGMLSRQTACPYFVCRQIGASQWEQLQREDGLGIARFETMDEAVTYLVQRGLAHINEAGDGWHVILETDE